MPDFTLRWVNRSTNNSSQDWQIYMFDNFTLQPNYAREAGITLHNDRTFQIAVNTTNTFVAAALTWTAATNTWTLNSVTPNEFQLQVGGGYVTVRCLLNAIAQDSREGVAYTPSEPARNNSE
jgi:hypothetical protein